MRSVLYATAILFAVAIVGLRGAFLWIEYRNALSRAEASTQDLALLMEEYTKRTLETSDLLLGEIITYVRTKGGVQAFNETGEVQHYLAELTRRSSASDVFLLLDRQGNIIASSIPMPNTPINLADRTWFKAHRAGAEAFVGGAIVGRITNELLYTYSRRISDANGDLDGVVQVGLRPTFLQNVSHAEGSTGNVILGIWGRDGRVIARTGLTPHEIDSSLGQTGIFNEMETQRTGTYRETAAADGTDRIVSFRRLERWPITVTASIPLATALAGWTSGLYWSVVVMAIILVAFGWLTWIGVRLSRQTEETQLKLQQVNGELEQANTSLGQALADKVTLLQEIHHRVKNNLQVTSSLLQMQSRRFADPKVKAAFQETQDRLRSVGLIHDILYRKDTGGTINLQDYLGRLISELSAAYGASARGIGIDLDAEPIIIDLERAAPLALAVTEALSNAFKHAFAPNKGGHIFVSARRIGPQIEIVVRDTGKGVMPGAESNDSSLGMKLISAFANQLDGRFSLESDGGTTFRLIVSA